MHFQLPSLYLTLQPDQPLTIAGGVGTEIRVLEGRVWLTEEGVRDDIFLFAGAQYFLRTSGRVVLDGATTTRIVLQAPVSVRAPSHRLANAARWVMDSVRRLTGAAPAGASPQRG